MPRRRIIIVIAALLFGAGLLLHTLLDANGWSRRQRVRRDLEGLRAQNAAIEGRITELRAQLTGLRSRPEVQERVVRDELGYARPGEVILEVPGPQDAASAVRP